MILAGHSLFFRDLVRRHLGPSAEQAIGDPKLMSDLSTKKLDNGACLCLDLEWAVGPGTDPMAPPRIVHASLVLGSRFKDTKEASEAGEDGAAIVAGGAGRSDAAEIRGAQPTSSSSSSRRSGAGGAAGSAAGGADNHALAGGGAKSKRKKPAAPPPHGKPKDPRGSSAGNGSTSIASDRSISADPVPSPEKLPDEAPAAPAATDSAPDAGGKKGPGSSGGGGASGGGGNRARGTPMDGTPSMDGSGGEKSHGGGSGSRSGCGGDRGRPSTRGSGSNAGSKASSPDSTRNSAAPRRARSAVTLPCAQPQPKDREFADKPTDMSMDKPSEQSMKKSALMPPGKPKRLATRPPPAPDRDGGTSGTVNEAPKAAPVVATPKAAADERPSPWVGGRLLRDGEATGQATGQAGGVRGGGGAPGEGEGPGQ